MTGLVRCNDCGSEAPGHMLEKRCMSDHCAGGYYADYPAPRLEAGKAAVDPCADADAKIGGDA